MSKKDLANNIYVIGARENNLKNVSLTIPKNKLVVMTGLSGSGKSSLAFNTIYAEGQRRYLESLSSYARQFLGNNSKPDVDTIEGLLPSISIDQKTINNNPRSTVGTVTEIYDYLRLLWARIGIPYCPKGHGPIKTLTSRQIVDKIYANFKEEEHLNILTPVAYRTKGTLKKEIENLKTSGYLRVRVDGVVRTLDEEINLNKNQFHNLDVVVDRIVLNNDNQTRARLFDSVEQALKQGDNKIVVLAKDKEILYSKNHSCPICGFSIPEMEPRLFSFNSPTGACYKCKGIGSIYEPDEDRMIPDKTLTINEGAFRYFRNTMDSKSLEWQKFAALIKHYKIPRDIPIKDLPRKQLEILLYGSHEPINISIKSAGGNVYNRCDFIEGVLSLIKRRHLETTSELTREIYGFYMTEKQCDECKGQRLNAQALSVKIAGKSIVDVCEMPITKIRDFFLGLELNEQEKQISRLVLKEIINRLTFLINVGLDYLTLSRPASSLSGGENQRIRLASQIGATLTGVLYVLDEPSIGLHQKDNDKLINTMKAMRDIGNSLIVVEHDIETMFAADYLIDVGPKAGNEGGKIIAQGTLQDIINAKNSITGKYLSGEYQIPIPKTRRSGNGQKIILKGINVNNLKNIDATFPLGKFICVTGVSGSGKSSLVSEALVKNLQKILSDPFIIAPKVRDIVGVNNVDKLVVVTQEPIGRTPKSNPATYTSLFDDIRSLFANTNEAKARGYSKSKFSFNLDGGRCEKCHGDGYLKIEMHFLPDVYIKCDECNGKRYNNETLSILYRNKSIYDVLEMSVAEAYDFFINIPSIKHKLEIMNDVGLGYLKLGAPSTTLSGGEAQRIKLAKFLQKKANSKSIIVLDEPSTGLHPHDVAKLIQVLNTIVDRGTTVIVIEHNLDIIKCADYVIDLGPDGGDAGGKIVTTGSPEQIIKDQKVSYTAQYLKKVLQDNKSSKKQNQ